MPRLDHCLGALWLAVGIAAAAAAAPEPPRPLPRPGEAGPVCSDPAILGERLPAVEGPGGCGIARPVRVRSVAGVALDPPPVVACPMARGLRRWLEEAAQPAIARRGERLVGLDVAAAYVCRTVNYAEEGRLSEHAKGRAIDISRFRLAGGAVISVVDDWGSPPQGALLRRMHAAACAIFGTALGPASDARHHDHFHYDVAARRRPHCP